MNERNEKEIVRKVGPMIEGFERPDRMEQSRGKMEATKGLQIICESKLWGRDHVDPQLMSRYVKSPFE